MNIHNFPRAPLYFDADWNIVDFETPVMVDLRKILIAAPGYKFGLADAAQIEARVCPWLAGDKEFLDKVREGYGVYEASARAEGAWSGGPLKKEDPALYLLYKARRLALQFGSGWSKFKDMAKIYVGDELFEKIFAKPVTEAQVKSFLEYITKYDKKKTYVRQWSSLSEHDRSIWTNAWLQVQDFRRNNPKITALWKKLDNDLKASVGKTYTIGLPSGRELFYYDVQRKGDGVLVATTKGGYHTHAYGGLLAENCVAGQTEVLTKRGWVRLDSVLADDLIFDGEHYVAHGGLIDKGEQEVIDFGGVLMTPDHKVWENEEWAEAKDAIVSDCTSFFQPHWHSRLWINRLGEIRGHLTAIKDAGVNKAGNTLWECICVCGEHRIVETNKWTRGDVTSCGCINKARLKKMNTTHGMSGTPIYLSWAGMLSRCYKPSDISYPNYGGRGIQVCDEWRHSFENFFKDMGASHQEDLSLDRKDNDLNYGPNNCKWSTSMEQCNNRRNNVFVETKKWGRLTIAQAARKAGMQPYTVCQRLTRGWDIETALTVKPDTRNRYEKQSLRSA